MNKKKKFNLLLPIAGDAVRFKNAGFESPKPLIVAKDKHVIDWAMDSIVTDECNIIFVVRSEHVYSHSIDEVLKKKFGDDITVVISEGKTDGALNTCLLAEDYINNDLPLIIFTPDVAFKPSLDPSTISRDLDGMLLTFKANSPAHSYILHDNNNLVIKTVEKEVISSDAAVGVYCFKNGSDFVKYSKQQINDNNKTKGEFYICPLYNYLIENNLKIGYNQVEKMYVLGTPQELEFFERFVIQPFGVKPIGLCSDHSGFELKEKLKLNLTSKGLKFIDFGTFVEKDCDYNSFVSDSVDSINKGICDYVIGSCRTANGVNICANKSENIRAAIVFDDYTAEFAIRHNAANFITLPSKYIDDQMIDSILDRLINSTFDGGRHMNRMRKSIGL